MGLELGATTAGGGDDGDDSDYGSIEDGDILQIEEDATKLKRRFSTTLLENEPVNKKAKMEGGAEATSIAQRILKKTWGFPGFKLAQEDAISRLITGESAAVIFPTGGGKSLVYQIPALAFDEFDQSCGQKPGAGVTLVISPLIALMKDQVDALRKRGVEAAAMDSSQSRDAWLDTCEKLKDGRLKLLYVAPERLQNEGFVAMIHATKIRMVAVDEAHCVSQWGHAFRPDYLKVARFVKEVGAERVLCLTATATQEVAEDICSAFGIEKKGVFRTTSYRANLSLLARCFKTQDEKLAALKVFLHDHKGPTIVYVQTHEQTDLVCSRLKSEGINAYGYHAGMATQDRTAVQEKFMVSKEVVIVATIAFGMGIDKADIRNIVHFAIPKSLEGYSQEIGRAGRDGKPSTCMVYLCAQDIAIMEEWSRADVPSLRSVKGLVGDLLELNRDSKAGDVLERNLNDESRDWDIKKNALDLLNAQLELHFELIRAITPKYSRYSYKKSPSFDRKTSADCSKLTKIIKATSRTAKVMTTIDVDEAANAGRLQREEVVRKLQQWHDDGAVELKPSGVVARFRVLKAFPKGEAEKKTVCDTLYQWMEQRERDDMGRIQGVIDFVTFRGCLGRELARHFGDEASVPIDGCRNCEYCMTGTAVEFEREGKGTGKKKVEQREIDAILAATGVRDDPKFLARVAFGISSPRVVGEKLSKHKVFGSMNDCDFEELVKRFSLYCGDG